MTRPRDPGVLEPQAAIIPLRQGLDLKTAQQVVDPPALLDLQNATLHAPGEISKDLGYPALPNTVLGGGALPSNPIRFVQHPTRQLLVCQDRILERTENPGTYHATSVVTGPASTGMVSAPQLATSSSLNISSADCANVNGFEMVSALTNAGTVIVSVVEMATGTTVAHTSTAAVIVGGHHLRCVQVGGLLCTVWVDGANLRIQKFDTAAPGSGLTAAANIVVDVLAFTPYIDAVGGSVDTTNLYIAYNQVGPNVRVIRINTATLAVLSSVAVAGTVTAGVAVCTDTTDNQLVAWCGAGGLSVFGATATTGVLRGNSLVSATVGQTPACVSNESPTGARGTVFYSIGSGAPPTVNTARHQVNMTGAGGSLATATLFGFYPQAKPRLGATRSFMVMTYRRSSGAGQVVSVCHLTANGSIAQADPLGWYAYDILYTQAMPNAVSTVSPSGSEFRFTGLIGNDIPTARIFQFRPYDGQAVALASGPYFCNSVLATQPGLFDATQPYEPVHISSTASVGAGLTPNGVYLYKFHFDYVLPDGTVIQGITSPAISYTAPAAVNLQVSLVVSTCLNRQGITARLRISRTTAGGTVFHTISDAPISDARAAGVTTYVDDNTDAVVAASPLIYTAGGVLDAYPGPMSRAMVLHQNRMFAIEEHTQELRYTRELVTGEGPAWHPSLAIDVGAVNVDPRELVSAESGLWVLGRDRITGAGAIALLLGQGAADDGSGSTYELQRLSSADVAPDRHSRAVTTPAGVFFEDPRQGFHLLPVGGGAPVFVGAPVEPLRTAAGVSKVVAISVLQQRKEVRVTMTDQLLVWHYDQNQWSRRVLSGVVVPLRDAAMWAGRHSVLAGVGAHRRPAESSPSYWDDGNQFQSLKLTTAWIKTSGFSGLQRIWRLFLLGRNGGAPHGLSINIQYDYDSVSAGDTFTWTPAEVAAALTGSQKYEFRVSPRRQRCEAFRVTVQDTDGGSSGLTAAWVALRLEYGALQGPSRKAAPNRKS